MYLRLLIMQYWYTKHSVTVNKGRNIGWVTQKYGITLNGSCQMPSSNIMIKDLFNSSITIWIIVKVTKEGLLAADNQDLIRMVHHMSNHTSGAHISIILSTETKQLSSTVTHINTIKKLSNL